MERENDYLFGQLDVSEVHERKSLNVAYGFYTSTYKRLSESISEAIVDNERREKNLDAILNDVFHRQYSKRGEDWKILRYRYRDFLRQFVRFLEDNQPLYRQLNARGLDIQEIETWRKMIPSPDEGNGTFLHFLTCSKWMVDNLWSIYRHFCKSSIITEFAYDGCVKLGVRWKDFIESLKQVAEGLLMRPIDGALQQIVNGCQMRNVVNPQELSELEKNGAAFAEYPYRFEHSGGIRILPLSKMVNLEPKLLRCYNPARRRLDLYDTYGMAVALFGYRLNGRDFICLSFAGTRFEISSRTKRKVAAQNVLTDLFQFLSLPSVVYFAAAGILCAVMKSYPQEDVLVFGHSLGGGLSQYACAAMNSVEANGYGYNSAGLSGYSIYTLKRVNAHPNNNSRIHHICSLHDPISCFGELLQDVKYVDSEIGFAAHGLGQLNERLNGAELKVGFEGR